MAAFPASPAFRAIDFECVDPSLADETQSGKENIRKTAAPYYRCTLRWNRLTWDDFAPVDAFIEALRGRFGTFTIVLPLISQWRGATIGTPVVAGVSQTGTELDIDGCPVSVTAWMKAGQVFTLAGHNKVYKLAANADTDAGGATTLVLCTPLMQSPADGEALTVDAVPFTMRRTNDVQRYALSSPDRYTLELDVREAL